MNMRRSFIITLASLMTHLAIAPASADPDFSLMTGDGSICAVCTDSPGLRLHESYGDIVLRRLEGLGLSDEQAGKILKIHEANQSRIQKLDQQLHAATRAAHALFLNPAADVAAIRRTADEHTSAFNELVETALSTRETINTILTAEQRQKLTGMSAKP